MALADMDTVFEGSDNGCGHAVPRELASVCILTTAVNEYPEDVLNPARADLGVENAFGLSSLYEVDDRIVGGFRAVVRAMTLE